ncbi:MAG: RNA-binding S4 domain-containing protein [Bacteroidota bacterium]|nr:RNA-binding S4 domain-containing protein [Bacteroidota bacterium]
MEKVRIDKWLWSVRLFKTRSQATDACKKNKVKINDAEVKPAKEVQIGNIISIRIKNMLKTVKVKDIIGKRVSAPIAATKYQDLTPEEEYNKLKKLQSLNSEWRDRGVGRPTKKERRDIDDLKRTS